MSDHTHADDTLKLIDEFINFQSVTPIEENKEVSQTSLLNSTQE